MTPRKIALTTLAASLLVALVGWGSYGMYRLGMQQGMRSAPVAASTEAATAGNAVTAAPSTGIAAGSGPLPQSIAEGEDATRRHIDSGIKAGDVDPITGRKVLYYHDPMVPGNKFDKPAKSPFMDMMLVPVYGGGTGDEGKVTVSPRIQQNLGVRTALVTEGALSPELNAVGSIAFNERDQVVVQARATGFVERVHARVTLDPVVKGQPLADIYVPEWVAAQEEFLAVSRMQGTDLASVVDAARQRMRQVGMTDVQIDTVRASGKPSPRITLRAPMAGVLTEVAVREGMTVMPGATLFRINGLTSVWANAEIPESQAALLRPGARVEATSPAAPGETFKGTVQALLPEVSVGTRTMKARLELANPGNRLVPGMFVQMRLSGTGAAKALLVPTEAVIQTGKRSVVILADKDGSFRPVEVKTGIESGDKTQVVDGLQDGQQVVVSSQFLIDSEASLKGVEARLNGPASQSGAAAGTSSPAGTAMLQQTYRGEARIDAVTGDAVTLTHGPIPALKWGAMTMDFKPPKGGLPPNVRPGDEVRFEFIMDAEGLPQLSDVFPRSPAAAGNTANGKKP